MKKLFLILAALITFSSPAFADHNGKSHGPLKTITVGVDGMVCDFCARALEKTFYQREEVQGVVIDLDTHTVTLEINKDATLSDEEITNLITQSGYNVNKITR
ncbi:MAG: heavy metal-associated domain-containing protein [Alphaproteobacteria bacterium]